jgi:hypothetical protein
MGNIRFFKDGDNREHFMWKQDESMSCALASLYYIQNAIRLSCDAGGEKPIKQTSANFGGSLAASQQGGGAGTGTSLTNISDTAKSLGIRITKYEEYNTYFETAEFDKSRLYDGRPALVAIRWRKGFMNLLPGGGHAVVAARITSKGLVVILDPWDPSLSEIQLTGGRYKSGFIMGVWYTGG